MPCIECGIESGGCIGQVKLEEKSKTIPATTDDGKNRRRLRKKNITYNRCLPYNILESVFSGRRCLQHKHCLAHLLVLYLLFVERAGHLNPMILHHTRIVRTLCNHHHFNDQGSYNQDSCKKLKVKFKNINYVGRNSILKNISGHLWHSNILLTFL